MGIILVLQGDPDRSRDRKGAVKLDHKRDQVLASAQLSEAYGKLPLSFEENRGQVDGKVKFLSRGSGYSLFLTGTEAVLSLSTKNSKKSENSVLRMKLVGVNPSPEVAGVEELPGKSNYFIGNDRAKWRTNVATYKKVKYSDVYPGIDLVYYGNQRQLEYDWIVAPGVEPEAIRFAVEGAGNITFDTKGDLVLAVSGGEVRMNKPVIYQEAGGVRHEIAGSYVSNSNQEIGFAIGDYDPALPLVIDPVMSYSTYLGGSGHDYGTSIAVDSSGSAYTTGRTASTNFPTASAGFLAGASDAFVTKLNPSGTALVYSTYLGGSGHDGGEGIAVDSSGSTYITGSTGSSDFPVANPLQPSAPDSAFVSKFSPSGSALVYSTYLGGSNGDFGTGIDVDSSGSAYVTGWTYSTDFPTANAFQRTRGSGRYAKVDAFVTKFNSSGSALVYSTYLGGYGEDYGYGIAVDSLGNAYVTGTTDAFDFPKANPFQATRGSGEFSSARDAFVTKFNPSGTALVYSTYLGGDYGVDIGKAIAVDSSGSAYVTGSTHSANFPTANPRQPPHGSADIWLPDAFVTKLNPSGSALVYSTYHGGSGADYAWSIAVDSSGNSYVTGETTSPNFPLANPLQSAYGGVSFDTFVTKFNTSGSSLVYSTYLGGSESDGGRGIAVDSSGSVYVTGNTSSTNFPVANAYQAANAGLSDVFITKIGELVPTIDITMSKSSYTTGDTITITEFRVRNPSPTPVKCRARVWLNVPTVGEIILVDIGEDGTFFFPPNVDANIGPVSLITITSSFPPRGAWELNSRITDPATGTLLSEDINPFTVQ